MTTYNTPTIRAMAALLEQPATLGFQSLVTLKGGVQESPVFIVHGLGGSAMEFFQLTTHIQSRRPIYGLQSKGIDGAAEPFVRVEDMAQFYLHAMKERQPRGPYFLMGYSFGGLVALEMAQRLSESGEKVALLAMLDTYPHPRHLRLRQRARLAFHTAKFRVSAVMQLPRRDALSYIARRSRRLLHISQDHNRTLVRPLIGVPLTPQMLRIRDSDYRAWTNYQPRFYRGKINFVRAQIRTEFPDDPVEVWADLARDLEVETVPGDHHGILSTYCKELAAVISGYLRQASC